MPTGKDDQDIAKWDGCEMEVTFAPRPYRVRTDDDEAVRMTFDNEDLAPFQGLLARYVSPKKTTGVKYETLPAGALRWATDVNVLEGEAALVAEIQLEDAAVV